MYYMAGQTITQTHIFLRDASSYHSSCFRNYCFQIYFLSIFDGQTVTLTHIFLRNASYHLRNISMYYRLDKRSHRHTYSIIHPGGMKITSIVFSIYFRWTHGHTDTQLGLDTQWLSRIGVLKGTNIHLIYIFYVLYGWTNGHTDRHIL